MTERYEVDVWEPVGTPVGRVLVLPGGMYSVDAPVLYWASQVAAGAGWQVNTLRWQLDDLARRDPDRFATEGAELIDATAPEAPVTVVIAKSFGTRTAAWANGRGYAGVWLTPPLTEPPVREALTIPGPPALSIGGTDDRVWDPAAAAGLRGTVLELAGVDHALHRGTDWRASLAALDRILAAVETFLGDQAWSRAQ